MDDLSPKSWFSAAIGDCSRSLYGMALRLTRNHADAEDLVAEAVAKSWAAIHTLQDRTRFRPWIFRILHNCYVSDYRKRMVRPPEVALPENLANDSDSDLTSLLVEQPDEFLHWWGSPEREFANKVLGQDILAAIDRLPEAYRVTVLLVTVEGLSYDEAAEVLGTAPGTVHSRMKRGRTLLQKALWQHARDAGLITDHDTERCIP